MSNINKLIIAAAGAGKTTYLINEALRHDKEVLITTYTEANENEIKKKFIEINGFIPNNIHIKGWFSFLLQECLKPYQCVLNNDLFGKKIGFNYWTDGQSGLKYFWKGRPIYWAEKDFLNHFFENNIVIIDLNNAFVHQYHISL